MSCDWQKTKASYNTYILSIHSATKQLPPPRRSEYKICLWDNQVGIQVAAKKKNTCIINRKLTSH